jgi:hypothetical protein
MVRGMSTNDAGRLPGLSNRSETGATASSGAWVVIAEVVVLQTGQKCEGAGTALKSAQK